MLVKIKYFVFIFAFLCCHSLVFSMGHVAEYLRTKMKTKDGYRSLLYAFSRDWPSDDVFNAENLKDQADRFQQFIQHGLDFDQISNDEYYRILCVDAHHRRFDIHKAIVDIRNNSYEYGTSSSSRPTAPPLSDASSNLYDPPPAYSEFDFSPRSEGFSPRESPIDLTDLRAQINQMKSRGKALDERLAKLRLSSDKDRLQNDQLRHLLDESTRRFTENSEQHKRESAALRSTIDQLKAKNQNLEADKKELEEARQLDSWVIIED